jgi:hypothetical protein
MATYLGALKDYQGEVEKIQNTYKDEMRAYQARSELFKEQATGYQKALSEWNIKRNSAVGEAEGLIKPFYTEFGWTFVDKRDSQAYWRKITSTWISQGIIIGVLMLASIVLIWRKDRG